MPSNSSRRSHRAGKARRFRLVLLAFAGLASLATAGIAWRITSAPDTKAYFASAEEARQHGDFDSAIIHYKNVLLDAPDHLEARWRLGQVYLHVRDIPAALATLEAARGIGAIQDEYWLDLARAQLDAQQHEEALQTLARYTGQNRAQSDALSARARLGLGETGAARTLLRNAMARGPAAASLQLVTARLALSEQDLAGAETAVRKALKLSPRDSDALLLLGRIQMLKGLPAAAAKSFQEASQQRSGALEGLSGMVEAQLTEGRLDDAEKTLGRLAAQARGTVGYEYLRGWLAFQRRAWSEAEKILTKVIGAAPHHPQALLMLANACYRQAKYNQAETYAKAFDETYPDQPAALRLLATILLKQRRPADALRALTPLATRDDLDAGTLALLSLAHYAKGEMDAGRRFLERAQALAPDSSVLQTQGALGAIAAGDSTSGIAELERIAGQEQAESPREALTFVLMLQGDVDAAAESARALVDLTPKAARAHNLLGITLAKQGDRAGARVALEKALSLDGSFAPALANLGLLALDDQQVEAGEKYLRDALAAAPGHTIASLSLASLLARRGEQAAAERVLEAAVVAAPDAAAPRWQLAERRLRAGDAAGALEFARAAHERSAGKPAADLLWGRFLAQAGRPQEGIEVLQKLHERSPDSVPVAVALGAAARAAGQIELAQRALRAALLAKPADAKLRWLLFTTELQARDFEAARRLLATMEDAPDDAAHAARARAELAAAQGRHAEAEELFEFLHEDSPSTASALRLAEAQRRAGRTEVGLRTLDDWLGEHPADVQVLLARGALALATADEKTAIDFLERALAQAPDNATALNNLAWLYDQKQDPRALDLARRAHAALPNSAETADTLGWILARQETADQALPLLEKARALLPEDPNIRYHQAYAWARSGKKDQAREALQALLDQAPDFDSEAEARALLRRLSVEGDENPDSSVLRF